MCIRFTKREIRRFLGLGQVMLGIQGAFILGAVDELQVLGEKRELDE